MPALYFIDTNIPIYAHGADHLLKSPCVAVLLHLVRSGEQAVTSTEVIQELIHRYVAAGRREHARQVTEKFLTIVADVLPVTLADVNRMLTYIERFPKLRARDLLHVAVMVGNGVPNIISADADFDMVPLIRRIDPRGFPARKQVES